MRLHTSVPLDFEHNHSPYHRLFLSPDDPRPHGYVHPDTVRALPKRPGLVTVDDDSATLTISCPASGDSPVSHVNAVLQSLVDASIDDDIFPILNRTHSEPFRILGAARDPSSPSAVVQVERFAAPLFGIATRGSHMTCYTRENGDDSAGTAGLRIWVARRSRTLYSHPGKLDSTVAGGVKATDSPTDCIRAEATEEASLPEALVRERARAAGVLTLANRNARTGLFHGEVLYVYDMELPAGLAPVPGDDEVETFELMGVDEVRRRMEAGEFKPNVCPVMLDFFVRHGVITPESEGEAAYVEICTRLRRRLPMPLGPHEGLLENV